MLWVITVNTYVCLQWVLVESSVHMGNDWFWRAVLPLTSVPEFCNGVIFGRQCQSLCSYARVIKNRLGHPVWR